MGRVIEMETERESVCEREEREKEEGEKENQREGERDSERERGSEGAREIEEEKERKSETLGERHIERTQRKEKTSDVQAFRATEWMGEVGGYQGHGSYRLYDRRTGSTLVLPGEVVEASENDCFFFYENPCLPELEIVSLPPCNTTPPFLIKRFRPLALLQLLEVTSVTSSY